MNIESSFKDIYDKYEKYYNHATHKIENPGRMSEEKYRMLDEKYSKKRDKFGMSERYENSRNLFNLWPFIALVSIYLFLTGEPIGGLIGIVAIVFIFRFAFEGSDYKEEKRIRYVEKSIYREYQLFTPEGFLVKKELDDCKDPKRKEELTDKKYELINAGKYYSNPRTSENDKDAWVKKNGEWVWKKRINIFEPQPRVRVIDAEEGDWKECKDNDTSSQNDEVEHIEITADDIYVTDRLKYMRDVNSNKYVKNINENALKYCRLYHPEEIYFDYTLRKQVVTPKGIQYFLDSDA